MRPSLLLIAAASTAFAQPFSFGVKAGLPFGDFFRVVNTGTYGYFSTTDRYIVGPLAEFKLPFGLGVEFDALYRHLQFTRVDTGVTLLIHSSTESGAWEFPLLVKYRFPTKVVRPYVAAGVAWDTLSGVSQTTTVTVVSTQMTTASSTSSPVELHKNTVSGFVVGGGVDIHALILHISPEIRYTVWGDPHFRFVSSPTSAISIESNQHQVEFLVGITFP
jgi:hypothetical protein